MDNELKDAVLNIVKETGVPYGLTADEQSIMLTFPALSQLFESAFAFAAHTAVVSIRTLTESEALAAALAHALRDALNVGDVDVPNRQGVGSVPE